MATVKRKEGSLKLREGTLAWMDYLEQEVSSPVGRGARTEQLRPRISEGLLGTPAQTHFLTVSQTPSAASGEFFLSFRALG